MSSFNFLHVSQNLPWISTYIFFVPFQRSSIELSSVQGKPFHLFLNPLIPTLSIKYKFALPFIFAFLVPKNLNLYQICINLKSWPNTKNKLILAFSQPSKLLKCQYLSCSFFHNKLHSLNSQKSLTRLFKVFP